MSDIQNTNTETQTTETPVETPTTPETPTRGNSDRGSRDSSGGRPRGNRRDSMREEDKEFKEELLAIDRVTRVTAGGRQIRFRASIVIGDGKGRIGLGIGKSGEVQGAIEKAIRDAKKNLVTFPIINGTIAHDVSAEYKSSSLYIHPAHPGTGIIAGGAIRKIFAVSGVKDVIAKQHGAPNKITNARVAMKALSSLKPVNLLNQFSKKDASSEKSSVSSVEKAPVKKAPAKTKKSAE